MKRQLQYLPCPATNANYESWRTLVEDSLGQRTSQQRTEDLHTEVTSTEDTEESL